MKTHHEIADEYDVRLKDVKAASAAAERIEIPHQVIIDPHDGSDPFTTTEDDVWWFVNSDRGAAYGFVSDRFHSAFAAAHTRWEAIELAIANGYRAD